jgi:hypothetical protein
MNMLRGEPQQTLAIISSTYPALDFLSPFVVLVQQGALSTWQHGERTRKFIMDDLCLKLGLGRT